MKYYQEILLSKLSNTGWELLLEDNDSDWNVESSWKVRSIREAYGTEIEVLFFLDPMAGIFNKKPSVWCITAYLSLEGSEINTDSIADTVLSKGKIQKNIEDFVNELNDYRSKIHS